MKAWIALYFLLLVGCTKSYSRSDFNTENCDRIDVGKSYVLACMIGDTRCFLREKKFGTALGGIWCEKRK